MGTRENGRVNRPRVAFPANSDESYVPLPQLAAHLERAVLASFAEVLSEECEVDFNENTLDSCSGEVTEALGRVVVYASAAEVAGRFSNNLRSKELERLRTALWELQVKLEAACDEIGGCSITVRHLSLIHI